MPFENHFAASIFDYKNNYYNDLDNGNDFFYDGLEDDGLIKIIDDDLIKY